MNIYPIELICYEAHYMHIEPLLQKVWLRIKPVGLSWYGLDGIITETTLTIHVFDMRDTCYGGKGDKTHSTTLPLTDLMPDETLLLSAIILRVQMKYAELELEKREQRARVEAIKQIHTELFGAKP